MRSVTRRTASRLVALVALALAPQIAHAWPHFPDQSVQVGVLTYDLQLHPDGAGGMFVAGSRNNGATGRDAWVQHYDASGNPLWGGDGVTLCSLFGDQLVESIVGDAAGGIVVSWQDQRSGASSADIYVQRVKGDGVPLWAPNGTLACNAADRQDLSKLVGDGYGGTYVVWRDQRTVGTTGTDIYAQYVSAGGVRQMGAAGAPVCTATGSQQSHAISIDLSGELYVVWADSRVVGSDIYAQKLNTIGTIAYALQGVPVCTATGSQSDPQIAQGNSGQHAIAWNDGRAGNFDVYAARLDDFSGSVFWTPNGVPVATGTGNQLLTGFTHDGFGGYVAVWWDLRGAQADIYAQKLHTSGVAQWIANGVLVRTASGDALDARIVPDGVGGTLLAWIDQRSVSSDIYAQRLNTNGTSLWRTYGVAVGTRSGVASDLAIARTSEGSLWCGWTDFIPDFESRMQVVDEWGYLGAEPAMAGVSDVPDDQGGRVRVAWAASALDTDPLFRNITDYLVFRSVPASLALALERTAPLAMGKPFEAGGRRFMRLGLHAATDQFWEEIGFVTARHLSGYSFLSATASDSVAGSNPYTSFMVMARADYGASWWLSAVDSAYSTDDLAPAQPAPFNGEYTPGAIALHWDANSEPDLAGYRVYRGTTAGFVTDASSFVAALTETDFAGAAEAPFFYKLTAIDVHGNESPAAFVKPQGTLDAGDATPQRAHFAVPRPNPARSGGGSTLRFALAVAGSARLTLHDAQGRTVRVLAAGEHAAGEHAVAFDGRDDAGRRLAPGLYLARLEAPGLRATQRLAVIE